MSEQAVYAPDRAKEHGATVLSAIIGGGGSARNLAFAGDRLTAEHFTDPDQAVLFGVLCTYNAQHRGVMSAGALADKLSSRKPGTRLKFTELYAALARTVPEAHELSHAVAELQRLAGARATGSAIATAAMIMRDTVEVDGAELSGDADARAYLLRALALASQAAGGTDSPSGDVITEGDAVLAEYERVKAARLEKRVARVEFGITDLDRYLGGLPNGLCLVVAPTSLGKSSLCVNSAWHNAVMLGLNVQFFTTEQSREETRLKFFARHSAYLGMPLDVARIRAGTLTYDEEAFLHTAADDLKTGSSYGRIELVQMPEPCTVEAMAARSEAYARWTVVPDVVFADYLQLFDPPRRTREDRQHENQAGIAKASHRWGQVAYDGRGVPLVSPWQPNQDGAVSLRTGAGFSIDRNMSQSAESARTASVVLTLGSRGDDTSRGRRTPLLVTVAKNRNGAANARFPVVADYAVSHFAGESDGSGGDDGFPDYDG